MFTLFRTLQHRMKLSISRLQSVSTFYSQCELPAGSVHILHQTCSAVRIKQKIMHGVRCCSNVLSSVEKGGLQLGDHELASGD
jgi:hypothetical protein